MTLWRREGVYVQLCSHCSLLYIQRNNINTKVLQPPQNRPQSCKHLFTLYSTAPPDPYHLLAPVLRACPASAWLLPACPAATCCPPALPAAPRPPAAPTPAALLQLLLVLAETPGPRDLCSSLLMGSEDTAGQVLGCSFSRPLPTWPQLNHPPGHSFCFVL